MHVSDLRDDWGVRPRQQVSCSLVLAGLTVQWTQRQSATMRTTPTTECMPHDLWWHHARTHRHAARATHGTRLHTSAHTCTCRGVKFVVRLDAETLSRYSSNSSSTHMVAIHEWLVEER